MPRFINQDSYLGEIVTPPSLHRYLYAFGNPTYYIDPDGNEPVSIYFLWTSANSVVDTGIDWASNKVFGGKEQFSVAESYRDNFAINVVTAGVGAKAKKLGKAARATAEFGTDVSLQLIQARNDGLSGVEAFTNAIVSASVDRAAGNAAVKSYRKSKKYFSNKFQNLSRDASKRFNKAKSYFSQKYSSAQNHFGSSNSQSDIKINKENPNGGSNLSVGITPENLGLKSISQNQKLLSMWTDSLKHLSSANTKGADKYRAYLEAMKSGDISKDVARSAYEEVAVQFRRRLKNAKKNGETFDGINFERLHHWNWPIGDFPSDATNAKKIFPVTHEKHMDTHREATQGPHPTKDPIKPENVLDELPQSSLPDDYYD